ncbi:hypothetical protein [Ornithobacterium rhinotracheale]|uniref:Uncharacterized protein n=5 Tax=Ornithobacterium rhinotracheale TaxID=28251 RepID=I4A2R2_ORNRL|nr:hypothetical protein [Ornithobacterium rhinotracheale]AFL98246.1 hypothetical protein Ornrh_2114 [Ornithobacterium rhinotracheale DSM 15997]AIQ00706.1 hypothetical protein Q785_10460 [Ornithobacterium rhinotracheale ORT-UMN 88]KGB66382.1 hypothetical protein Q787_10295 [Ornithobacterium rhinotracheale H06-030791]MCK0193453.1 hypothetical protein [Ornithobacterium rhinotracheale]MCK0201259.1 hypothetical protein [Ornithobacterium rhinotracheale]
MKKAFSLLFLFVLFGLNAQKSVRLKPGFYPKKHYQIESKSLINIFGQGNAVAMLEQFTIEIKTGRRFIFIIPFSGKITESTFRANGQEIQPQEKIVGADFSGLSNGEILRIDTIAIKEKSILERLNNVFGTMNDYNQFLKGRMRIGNRFVMRLPMQEIQKYMKGENKDSDIKIIYTLTKIDKKYAYLDLSVEMPELEFESGIISKLKGKGGARYDKDAKFFDKNDVTIEISLSQDDKSVDIINDISLDTKVLDLN